MGYPKLIKKDLKLNDAKFEYDCGDLWLREDVSFWGRSRLLLERRDTSFY